MTKSTLSLPKASSRVDPVLGEQFLAALPSPELPGRSWLTVDSPGSRRVGKPCGFQAPLGSCSLAVSWPWVAAGDLLKVTTLYTKSSACGLGNSEPPLTKRQSRPSSVSQGEWPEALVLLTPGLCTTCSWVGQVAHGHSRVTRAPGAGAVPRGRGLCPSAAAQQPGGRRAADTERQTIDQQT